MKIKNQDGLSLIEVIVSMFLIVALFVLYLSALNTVLILKKTNTEDIAYHIANKQMEALREIPIASLPAAGSITDSQLTLITAGTGSYAVNNYASMAGMKEIVVTVGWTEGSLNKQVVIRTLAGTGGINP